MRPVWLAVRLAMVLLAGVESAEAGPPQWVEVRSEHFTVLSDAGEKEAGKVARQFERFRVALAEILPKARLDPGIPVLIFAARNERSFRELLPEFWEKKDTVHPTGFFTRGTRRYYIVLRTDVDVAWRDGENPFHVLYHEYVHLVIDLNYENVPVWLNEGLAEFIGATVVTSEAIEVGRPIWPHVELLRAKKPVPTAMLFKVDHSSPEYNERDRSGVLYAQSWALVHYLLTDPKAVSTGALSRFLSERHGQGDAASVFGDTAALDRALEAYLTRRQLPYGRKEAGASSTGPAVRSRALSAAESAAARGLLHVQMNRAREARSLLEEALRLDPRQADAREGMGVLAWREEKEDEARRWLGEAVRLPSASALAHYSYAMLLVRPPHGDESLAEAAASLEKAVVLDPGFADAYVVLAQVSAKRGADVDRVRGLMRRAVELEPGVFDHRLTAARLLLACGEIEEARSVGGRLAAGGRSDEERGAARSFLASLSSPAPVLARDIPALVRILEKRCDWGNAHDCLELADRHRQGEGVAADHARAAPLYEKACAEDLFEACAGAAWVYERGEGVTRDAARTHALYDKACTGGDLFSCGHLGWLLAEGQLLDKDEVRGLLLSGKACDGGQILACNTVGVIHVRRQEYGQAVPPFTRCCDAGEAVGCGNLALLHEQGRGVPRDPPRAVALHRKACDAGLASSCERLKGLRRP
jgi:TPR repeat protein